METVKQAALNVLSGLRPQSQENMTTSDDDKRRRDWAAAHLGGYRALDAFTAEKFNTTDVNREAFKAASSFDPVSHNLYLFGPTGSGKSHLAAIAIRARSDTVYTVTQMQLAREVRFAQSSYQEQEIIDKYVRILALVIDDLGAGKDTEFSLGLLYEIINGRYMNTRGGLVVTSNLSLGQIAEKTGDDRVSSRLAQMCKVFSLAGEPDHRLSKGVR